MSTVNTAQKIILPGGAGLVGQNLVTRLLDAGYSHLVVIDKHASNLAILRQRHPNLHTVEADLSQPGDWMSVFDGAAAVVILQAQIGGLDKQDFVRNNLDATGLILGLVQQHSIPSLVHISSSVVTSVADDFYTQTKIEQENMVLASGIVCPILRPTLMFGWFDRKHLGWLSRFMQKVPVFPVPGDGRYMRQPLYAGDFCNIIMRCLQPDSPTGVFNISGHEKIDYIDIIREIKQASAAKAWIVKIPYPVFYGLLWVWSLFDKNPPFTTQQLQALIAKDDFEIIDWPAIFGVTRTPFAAAIAETFAHPVHSRITLDF